ncbi:MAG: YfhO family protein [Acidobacteriota bacterium]
MTFSARFRLPALLLLLAFLPFFQALTRFEVFQFRDHYDYFVPLHYFTTQRLAAADLPLWNPYSASGEPWLANPQTGVFYPPALLFLVFPFPTAYVLFLFLHLAILGVGAFFLFRRWAPPAAAFFGAAALMLSGPVFSLLDVSNNLCTFAWVPIVLWCAIERTEDAPSVPPVAGGAALAMAFLAGEPFLAAVAALLYAAVQVWKRRASSIAGELAATALIAIGLAAAQLVPFVEMLRGSDRLHGLDRELALRQSLHPLDWAAAALPPHISSLGLLIGSQTFIASLYLGGTTVFLAVACLIMPAEPRLRRAKSGWVLLLLLTVLLSAGSQIAPVAWVTMAAHLNVSRYPSRLVPFSALAICALACIGTSGLAGTSRGRRICAGAATALLVIVAAVRFRPQIELSSPRAVASILFLVLVLVLAVEIPALFKRQGFLIVLTLFVAAESLFSARPFLVSAPFTATVQPWARTISSERKLARVPSKDRAALASLFALDRTSWYSGYLNLIDRKYDLSTASPLISRRYARIHDAALFIPRLDLLDFLSVGYLISDRAIQQPSVHPFFRLRNIGVYLNESSGPMATLWHRWTPAVSDAHADQIIFGEGFDAGRTVVASPQSSASPSGASGAPEEIRIDPVQDEDVLRMKVTTTTPAFLVMNQVSAPGWRLFIDGKEQSTVRADGLFLGAMIPPGNHQVQWCYEPRFIFLGMVISLLAFGWSTFRVIKFLQRAS